MARAFPHPYRPARTTRDWLGGQRIFPPRLDDRDFQPQYLQFHVHYGRAATALEAEAISDGGSQVGTGDLRRADPVPILWRHRRYPDPSEKQRRDDCFRSDHPCLVSMSTQHLFPLVIGIYSAILGFFIPSGGGKWLLEAPYVKQAANDLKVHLGWAVQVYNAAEALPNLINPFWMLPLLGVLGLRARDVVGFTFLQLLGHLPVVLFLLWALAYTLEYHQPVIP